MYSTIGDRAVLAALYKNTDGANWRNNTNWLTRKPVATWYGVGTDRFRRVNVLELEENNLKGTIPTEFASLDSLVRVHLDGNELEGIIPPETGRLTRLEWLGLGGNGLTGSHSTRTGESRQPHLAGSRRQQSDRHHPAAVGRH